MTKITNCLFFTTVLFTTFTSCSSEIPKNPQLKSELNITNSNIDEQSDEDYILTLAVTEGSYGIYADKIDEFNSSDNGYKIVLKNYDEFFDSSNSNEYGNTLESFAEIDNQIALDIIKGEDIDIITDFSFTDTGKFNELVKKGAFTDLYQFLDADNDISRDTFFENILKLNEINGELATIPLFFSVKTLYGETKYVGEKENWNLNEMIEHWEKVTEEISFNGTTTRESVYMEILMPNLTSYVDIEKGTANFDSLEFLKLLNFINTFPNSEGYKTEPNYAIPNFISNVEITSFDKYHNLFYDTYEQPCECTFVGYPSEDGGSYISPIGRFGISANSSPEKQKGAWLFLKSLLDYDYQYEWGNYFFPINYKAFSKLGENEYSKSNDEYKYTIKEEEYTGTYLSYEEYNRLLNFIKNIKKVDCEIDNSIIKIIEDEILFMIWDEKSPEETAAIIQNQVEILISEKY